MPILSKDKLEIDYIDEGMGSPVILIHSSVSTNRQWHALIEELKGDYRVLAINLYGYGKTTPWPENSSQSLLAQAQLVIDLCEEVGASVNLVGHSFGGSVALKAAMALDSQVEKLILLEPNPFALLKQYGRMEAYSEIQSLGEQVRCYGSLGDWINVAERFADYWLGEGSWQRMPEKRRAAFVESLPPNYYEWDAVMNEHTTLESLKELSAKTMVVSDKDTQRPIKEAIELLAGACPHWDFQLIEGAGHMAPLTHPELINPVVRKFLDASSE